jgi:hypothetical protein
MQVLDVQQSSPTPYTPAGGTYNNNPIPGAGGLPSLSGLNNRMNPMAQELQGQGRGDDSVLVHMTPGEVNSLRGLAQRFGGDLSINPNTGLPEASFLKKLLPTLLGAGLSFIPGVGPLLAAGIVGGGQTLLTGDINKGLMAGLQAFGGASLGGAAGAGKVFGAKAAAGSALPAAAPTAGFSNALNVPAMGPLNVAATPFTPAMSISGLQGAASIAPSAASIAAPAAAAKTGLAGFGQKFGAEAARGLGTGMAAKYAPYAAGYGLLSAANEASMPTVGMPEFENKSEYKGPYFPAPRTSRFRTPEEMRRARGAAFDFFGTADTYPSNVPAPGMAEGGIAALPAAGDFQATVDYFNRNRPGAITESMYPVSSDALARTSVAKDYNLGPKTPPPTGPVIPGSGGEAISTSAFSPNTNYGGGANAIDLATMYGGRMSSEIAPNLPPNMSMATSLPGTKLDAVKVSGQGIMPDFKLDPLRINPVERPGTITPGVNVSGQGIMPDFRLADLRVNPVETLSTITPGVNVSGQGYMPNFRLADLRVNPVEVFKDPEEFEETKARGGEVNMKDGSFVVDARTVSEMGNGSSNAGIERLAAMGGHPVRGDGDGVSDSVPARIGGKQKARVARDEVIFSPEAVARVGGGDHSKGTKKLYALMNKAHKARKKAGRGQDTKVAKGLGGLA